MVCELHDQAVELVVIAVLVGDEKLGRDLLDLRAGGGARAGLLPRRVRGNAELWMLCGYGIVASYLFGRLTNLWFWPFSVGASTGISYIPGGLLATNLSSFLLYSLVTPTAGWDTLRAVTTIIGLAVVGRPILAALRRVKPVSRHAPGPGGQRAQAQPAQSKDPRRLRV